MEKQPKFKIGSTIWTIEDCKLKSFVVNKIIIKITESGTTIGYSDSSQSYMSIDESLCFMSKQALLNQL